MFEEEQSKWEFVDWQGEASFVDRLEVPGGWIYRSAINDHNNELKVNLVFVPFPRV